MYYYIYFSTYICNNNEGHDFERGPWEGLDRGESGNDILIVFNYMLHCIYMYDPISHVEMRTRKAK